MTAAKKAGGFLLGTLFIAGCCIDPFPANATEPTDGGVTAVWYAAGTNQWPADGQTLRAHTGSPSLDLAFVQSTAAELGCGFTIQGDFYADDATTAALLAGGKLYAPGNPAESWPNGQYLPEYSTVFYTGDCAVVVPPVVVEPPIAPPVTPEIPTPELPAEPVATAPLDTTPAPVIPAPTEPVVAAPVAPVPPVPVVVAETPAPEIAPPVVESRADVVADQVAAKVPVLAATGVDMATPAGFGLLFVLAGICFLGVKRLGKRESK